MATQNTPQKVNILVPCSMDMFAPATAYSMISVLERLGITCNYNENQTCCGRRFYIQGDVQYARELATKLMNEHDFDLPLIVPSAACAGYIKNYYQQLTVNSGIPLEVKKFTENVYELCHFIVSVLGIEKLGNTFNQRVFYYKSCGARNLYKLQDEAEILLKNTIGLDLLTDPTMNTCCSANGNFATQNPEISDKMLKRIVDKIYAMGAQYVTSTDVHCLQHLEAFIQANGIGLEVIHIADILNGINISNEAEK